MLIRGLEKYENGKHVGNISGSQRCLFDMFNASDDMPKLIEDKPLDHIEILAQGGLSVADGCRCLTKELDMIAC